MWSGLLFTFTLQWLTHVSGGLENDVNGLCEYVKTKLWLITLSGTIISHILTAFFNLGGGGLCVFDNP